MNDANRGASQLVGLVANVPLSCGSVETTANLFIGDRLPFDLLLGHPWQRGNFISIDERVDGTYIVFKNPTKEGPYQEMLVRQRKPTWTLELIPLQLKKWRIMSYALWKAKTVIFVLILLKKSPKKTWLTSI
jgi:hypothetical protein